ncbi:hypothetical protein DM01DRAFT_1348262 [Hesseltinella vesiculosa]|uniref:Uncharacterized protein n=1 Tax=Hesseltinella vesiculosa TaxID=101127 RepID=A0A1X2G975_9FUNG|nr:hypothetical protein DM01DRAFT_1348262 [Hesseltinella vesiculosa]
MSTGIEAGSCHELSKGQLDTETDFAPGCTNTTRRLDLADFNFELIFTVNWTVSSTPVCTRNMVISNVQAPSNTPSVFLFGGDSTFMGTSIGYLINPTDYNIVQTITDPTNSSIYAT